MIELIIFDLDGVLVDSRRLHYDTFNMALDDKYKLTYDEHLAKYDGHPTTYKLKLLSKEKGLDPKLYDDIWKRKQDATQQYILENFKRNDRVCEILKTLKQRGYKIYCASNSIWETIKNSLLVTGFMEYIDFFISNEDVKHTKPSSEIYLKCFERANVPCSNVMICEDSPVGRKSAVNSGAHLCPIENPDDVTLDKLEKYILKFNNMDISHERIHKNINIVIPAAGLGSRFANAGYTFPKPLIDVNGKPMIQKVVDNINIKGKFIFIVQKSHYEKYNLKYLLNAISPGCVIVQTEGLTEGSACTVMLAKEYINNEDPVIIANSDQILEWDANHFVYASMSEGVDGCISIFENTHPKFSYASLGDDGYVNQVAEKLVISNNATTGIYFWRRGSDCVKYTNLMIQKNIRTNGEFYNCPVFNEAIQDGKKIKTVKADKFWCIGTPEDLENYLRHNPNTIPDIPY